MLVTTISIVNANLLQVSPWLHGGWFHPRCCAIPVVFLHQTRMSEMRCSFHRQSLKSFTVPIRLAWFWVSNYLTVMVSAFLATGILLIPSGHGGWRYLFLIEGLITFSVGIASVFLMPPGPTQTKAWFRPRGWFTEREEIIMVNRFVHIRIIPQPCTPQ